jgi:hypothetical protein
MFKSLSIRTALFALIATLACGSDSTSSEVTEFLSVLTGDAEFSAAAAAASLTAGVLTIQAQGTSGEVARTLQIQVNATAPATIALGTTSGASVTYTELAVGTTSPKAWRAGGGSGSGTLTITELSTTKVAGTFFATVAPVLTSGAAANKSLTNGTFSIRLYRQ